MEIFLSTCERETLLRERLVVIQRMIVADRVRSLAAMAGGISHHLRNSMTALTCYLEETAPKAAGGVATDPQFAEQLWALAHKERDHLLQIIQRVGQTAGETRKTFENELGGDELIKRGVLAAVNVSGRNIQTTVDPAAPRLKLDPDAATTALKTLINYVARLSESADKLTIAVTPATIAQKPAASIRVWGGSKPWTEQDVAAFFTPFAFPASDPSDLGVELLGAFSVAYQHGGDIMINRAAPAGPGFELLLPADPAQVQRPDLQEGLLEKLFTHFETAAATSSPAQPVPKAA